MYERARPVAEDGHDGYVLSIAVLDGGELVSGGRDKTIRVRQPAARRAHRLGHRAPRRRRRHLERLARRHDPRLARGAVHRDARRRRRNRAGPRPPPGRHGRGRGEQRHRHALEPPRTAVAGGTPRQLGLGARRRAGAADQRVRGRDDPDRRRAPRPPDAGALPRGARRCARRRLRGRHDPILRPRDARSARRAASARRDRHRDRPDAGRLRVRGGGRSGALLARGPPRWCGRWSTTTSFGS